MKSGSSTRKSFLIAALAALFLPLLAHAAPPLKIAYSDWPGWVAWDIGVQKGWFKEAGVNVKFLWFEYGPSMDAYAAGKVDAVCVTNGDALVTGASGAKSIMILINDYSNGNDMVVAAPGYDSLKSLKGKKIGVEIGLVDHLLLLNGLKKAGMSPNDVTLVNMPTNQAAQVLASGDVQAVAAWQPNSGEALKAVPGSKPVYTSADEPGLIYDVLTVSPKSLAEHRAEWMKVIKVWYRIVNYIYNPKTRPDAIKIMSARVNLTPAQYKTFVNGTKILTLPEAQKFMHKGKGFTSLYGSSTIVDKFNVDNKVYTKHQDVDAYIDPSLLLSFKK